MSRFKRRILAAMVGLSLGWIAAGMTFPTAHAADETSGPAKAEKTSPEKPVHDASSTDAAHADRMVPPKPASVHMKPESPAEPEEASSHRMAHAASSESDENAIAAKLVPESGDDEQIWWFKPVLGIIACLFVAALLLGWFAAAAKGPPPPEPADDDHAHDAKHDAPAAGGHSH